MSEPLRLALVGAGHMGMYHAGAIAERDDADLVAVCDVDRERAAGVAAAHGAHVVGDVGELAGAVDAAVVAASTSVHEEVAIALLEAGIAVLIEKPLAATADEARRIADAARRTGVVAQVGHILRFDPVTRAVAGRRIRPAYVEVSWVDRFSFRSMDTGVVMDVMIHGLDVVLFLAGEMPERVDAVGGAVVGPHEDFVNVRLQFPGGCVATLSSSRMSRTRQRLVRVFADGAYVKMDYAARTVEWLTPKPGLSGLVRSGAPSAQIGMDDLVAVENVPVETEPDALRAQLASFLAAVRGEGDVAVTVEDGVRAVEVAERVIAAVRGG